MKKLITPLLVLTTFCTYAVCVQPEKPVVQEAVEVDEQGEGIYDQFDPPEDEDITPPPVTGDRVLVIGDSEACAVGRYAADNVWRDASRLGNTNDVVKVECKVSTTVEYWVERGRMRRVIDDFRPDVVVIFLGTNHWGSRKTPDVKPILDMVKENDLRCVWVGNTAVRGKHWAINGLLRNAVSPACTYFDTEASGVQLSDGVHPGPAAAQRWLRDVWMTIPSKNEDGVCTW